MRGLATWTRTTQKTARPEVATPAEDLTRWCNGSTPAQAWEQRAVSVRIRQRQATKTSKQHHN